MAYGLRAARGKPPSSPDFSFVLNDSGGFPPFSVFGYPRYPQDDDVRLVERVEEGVQDILVEVGHLQDVIVDPNWRASRARRHRGLPSLQFVGLWLLGSFVSRCLSLNSQHRWLLHSQG